MDTMSQSPMKMRDEFDVATPQPESFRTRVAGSVNELHETISLLEKTIDSVLGPELSSRNADNSVIEPGLSSMGDFMINTEIQIQAATYRIRNLIERVDRRAI